MIFIAHLDFGPNWRPGKTIAHLNVYFDRFASRERPAPGRLPPTP